MTAMTATLVVHESPNFGIRTLVHAHLESSMNYCVKRSNFRTTRTSVLANFCSSFVH